MTTSGGTALYSFDLLQFTRGAHVLILNNAKYGDELGQLLLVLI